MRGVEPILDEAIRAMQAERGYVILAGDQLEFVAARSDGGTNLKAHAAGISRSIVREVLASGQARLAHDTDAEVELDPRVSVRLLGLRALMCAPLVWEDVILGVLYLDSSERDAFADGDLERVAAFAQRVAAALG